MITLSGMLRKHISEDGIRFDFAKGLERVQLICCFFDTDVVKSRQEDISKQSNDPGPTIYSSERLKTPSNLFWTFLNILPSLNNSHNCSTSRGPHVH